MNTIRKSLLTAEKKAVAVNKEASAIKLLMQDATKMQGYDLVANLDKQLTSTQSLAFEENVVKYLDQNLPVQYLIGYETFFGYEFKVNDAVLIPRFETEELVAKVLDLYDEYFGEQIVDVVDIGTGSGAIGITLALEAGAMKVTATDISEEALQVARANAQQLGVAVTFLQSDMLNELLKRGKKFDILVSNPPYIPQAEKIEALVYDNEPHLALFGGDDGLHFYRQILRDANQILKQPNIMAFEHANHHRQGLTSLARKFFPEAVVKTFKDLQGRDRITVIINSFKQK